MDVRGARESQKEKAVLLLNDHPGTTSLELAQYGILDRFQLARRLSDLRDNEGTIKNGPDRICNVNGELGLTS